MPRISIIVPVYNASLYLSRCIESILHQSVTDFELLIINDGSTDGSMQIAEKYVAIDKRIRLFSHSNSGVSFTRKKGVLLARGEWITFVDSDDVLFENALKIMLEESEGVDIVNASLISTNGTDWNQKNFGVMMQNEYIKSLLDSTVYGVPVAKLYKKELLTPDVFDFPSNIRIGEDVLMNIKIAQKISKVINIPDKVYCYCNNDTSTMRTYSRSVLYYLRYFDMRNSFLSKEHQSYSLPYDVSTLLKAFYDDNVPYKRIYMLALKKYLIGLVEDRKLIDCNLMNQVTQFLNTNTLIVILKKNLHYYKVVLRKLFVKESCRIVID